MMHRMMTLAALLLLTLSACEKKEAPAPTSDTTPATPSAAPAVPAAAAPATPEPVVDVASLPVEEQYEADADKEITAANLSTKLDELEKEIAAP